MIQFFTNYKNGAARSGFTLVEMLLALGLVVAAAALVGTLMQLYASSYTTRSEDVRRMQLAHAILHMIANDIRAVVTEQEYDGSVLEQQLGAIGGGSGSASESADSDTLVADDLSGLDDTSISGTQTSTNLADPTYLADLPPGLYGDQYTLTLDVSRVPRPDEYFVQQPSVLEGVLPDVPGDIKKVTYYVQAPSAQGVVDEMATLVGSDGSSSGLVRRVLDRHVLAHAQEMGNMQAAERTGDLIAPEVVALEFAYFDANQGQWVYTWDSSQQSLPVLVQIAVAIQTATGEQRGAFQPGTPISSLTLEDRKQFGIEVYELIVAIPGANLKAAEAASAAQMDAGMEAVGL